MESITLVKLLNTGRSTIVLGYGQRAHGVSDVSTWSGGAFNIHVSDGLRGKLEAKSLAVRFDGSGQMQS